MPYFSNSQFTEENSGEENKDSAPLNQKNTWKSLIQKTNTAWQFFLGLFRGETKVEPKINNLEQRSHFATYRQKFHWPTKYQWRQIIKVLTQTERYLILIFAVLILVSAFFPIREWYLNHTKIVPDEGGTYKEAAVGAPRYINPVLASANDVDRDISVIIFSSIVKHGSDGELILDLADSYSISEDGKVYEITLKKNVIWHDKKPLTADDVIFTVRIIQNPDYKSPLRISLQGVEVEKINDYSIRFALKNPYAPFLGNLTFGILPKHIWENIPPASFPLTELNLKPIGSGPYKFKKLIKDAAGDVKSLEITAFKDYYLGKPFINNIIFSFFKDEDSAIEAFNNKSVDGMSFISAAKISQLKNNGYVLNKFILPRYFSVFFNQSENKALADINVRQALNYLTDRKKIITQLFENQAVAINCPVPGFIFDRDFLQKQTSTSEDTSFSPEQAISILETSGWKLATSTSDQQTATTSATTTLNIRQKIINNEVVPLEITLTTVNWPELTSVANILKEHWEKAAIVVNIEVNTVAEIQEKIKSRQYQALLFGQILGANPDPFAFWHSSQKKDPGLNLALYENKEADKLLEETRQEKNPEIKMQKYQKFNEIVSKDIPAIFLYSPVYIFPTSKTIQGIEMKNSDLPSARFSQVHKWYIETKRGWK